MARAAKLLAITASMAALISQGGCSSKCNSAFDCKSTEVCYRGTCQEALSSNLSCVVDDDCGKSIASGTTRPYICIAGRCQANPADGGAGQPGGDSGTDAGMMMMTDTGMTTPDTGMTQTDTGVEPPDSGVNDDATVPDSGTMMAACMLPAGATSTAEDTTEPQITSAMIDMATPSPNATVTLTLMVAEAGCGLESAIVRSQSEFAPNPDNLTWMTTISGTGPYTVTATMNVSECLANGVQRISFISLRDFAGNTNTYTFNTAGANYNQSINGQAPIQSTLGHVTFTPSTGGTTLRPPVLNMVTASETAAGVDVAIVAMSQGMCPLVRATVTATGQPGGYSVTASGTLAGTGGTVSIPIPACAGGTFTIASITLEDMIGRTATYIGAAGNYLGPDLTDSGVAVAQIALARTGTDMGSPVVTGAQPPMVNMSAAGDTVTITALATEQTGGCGIAGGSAAMTVTTPDGTRAFSGNLLMNAGGVSGCVAIPACARRGTYTLSTVSVNDTAGSSTTLIGAAGGNYTFAESDGTVTSTVTLPVFSYTR